MGCPRSGPPSLVDPVIWSGQASGLTGNGSLQRSYSSIVTLVHHVDADGCMPGTCPRRPRYACTLYGKHGERVTPQPSEQLRHVQTSARPVPLQKRWQLWM